MIKKFSEYNEYLEILESKSSGPVIIYFSPRLRDMISNINNGDNWKISDDLLRIEGSEITEDITFVDIDENNNSNLTFIKWQTAINLIKKEWEDQNEFIFDKSTTDYIFNRILYDSKIGKNSIKIGKFINKILKAKYSANQLEKYTNEFKSISNDSEALFELVSGDEIAYWYNRDNYYYKPNSTLWQSCMSNKEGIFDIYVENPQSCQLLILKTKNNKLLGRALVWKLNSIEGDDAQYFMDRVYSIEDYHVNKFVKFAKEKNWAFRFFNNAGYWGDIQYKDKRYIAKMSVKIKRKEYKKYPYLDTFVRYDSRRGILYNDIKKEKGGHILRDTGGGYDRGLSRGRMIINRFRDFFTSD